MTPVAWVLATVAAFVVLHVAAVALLTASLILPNPLWRFTGRGDPARWGIDAATVRLPNGSAAFYVTHPTTADPVVLVCHGRSRHRRWMLPLVARLATRWSVLAIDFPSHGDGRYGTTSVGLREADAVDTAIAWLRASGHARIWVYGVSMGGAASLIALGRQSAATRGVAGLVTDGAFDALTTVVDHTLRWFPWVPPYLRELALTAANAIVGAHVREVRPVDHVGGLDVPATFLHGDHDWLVPPRCGAALETASRGRGRLQLYAGRHDEPTNPAMQAAVVAAIEAGEAAAAAHTDAAPRAT